MRTRHEHKNEQEGGFLHVSSFYQLGCFELLLFPELVVECLKNFSTHKNTVKISSSFKLRLNLARVPL